MDIPRPATYVEGGSFGEVAESSFGHVNQRARLGLREDARVLPGEGDCPVELDFVRFCVRVEVVAHARSRLMVAPFLVDLVEEVTRLSCTAALGVATSGRSKPR